MSKINKALDYNRLLQDQAKGKLLKKKLMFPLYAGLKMDGNYTVIIKESQGLVRYITSGGHEYTPNEPTFIDAHSTPIGVYIAERIGTDGKLGDRVNCSLRGKRGEQIAHSHKYLLHDWLTLDEYYKGMSYRTYSTRRKELMDIFTTTQVIRDILLNTRNELEAYLVDAVKLGYEGLMLKQPEWYWKDTKSRTVDLVKYKKRPTADLLCIGITEGTKKYEGMIGALVLVDSQGREVSVGSGLSDEDRSLNPSSYIGKVIEIEYEQIIDTYIQPTFIQVRHDKDKEDID